MNSKGKIFFAILAVALMLAVPVTTTMGNLGSESSNSNSYGKVTVKIDADSMSNISSAMINNKEYTDTGVSVSTGAEFVFSWIQNSRDTTITGYVLLDSAGKPIKEYKFDWSGESGRSFSVYVTDEYDYPSANVTLKLTWGAPYMAKVYLKAYLIEADYHVNLTDICDGNIKATQDEGIVVDTKTDSNGVYIPAYAGETYVLSYTLREGYIVYDCDAHEEDLELLSLYSFYVYDDDTYCLEVMATTSYLDVSSATSAWYYDSVGENWYGADNAGLNNSVVATTTVDKDGLVKITVYGTLYKQSVTATTTDYTSDEWAFYNLNKNYSKEGRYYGLVLGSLTGSDFWIDDYQWDAETQEPKLVQVHVMRSGLQSVSDDVTVYNGSMIMYLSADICTKRNIYIGDDSGAIQKVGVLDLENLSCKQTNETVAKVYDGEKFMGNYDTVAKAIARADKLLESGKTDVRIKIQKDDYEAGLGNGEVFFFDNIYKYDGPMSSNKGSLSIDNTIYEGLTIEVLAGATLTINGATLNFGKIVVDEGANLIVRSILQNSMIAGSYVQLQSVPSIVNDGTLTVASDSVLSNYGLLVNNGTMVNMSGSYDNLFSNIYSMAYWLAVLDQYYSWEPLKSDKAATAIGKKLAEDVAFIGENARLDVDIPTLAVYKRLSYLLCYTCSESGIVNNNVFINNGTINNMGVIANGISVSRDVVFTNNGTINNSSDASIVNGMVGSNILQEVYLSLRYVSGNFKITSAMSVQEFIFRLIKGGSFVVDGPTSILRYMFSYLPEAVEFVKNIEPVEFYNYGEIDMGDGCKFVNYYGKFVNSGKYTGAGELDDLAVKTLDFHFSQFYNDESAGVNVTIKGTGAEQISDLAIIGGMTIGESSLFDYNSKTVCIATAAFVDCVVLTADGLKDVRVKVDSITYEAGAATMKVDLSGIEGEIKQVSVLYVFEAVDGDYYLEASNAATYYDMGALLN